MAYKDLRGYLDELAARDLLHVIDEPVSRDTDIVPLVRLQFRGLPEEQRKGFWFRKVTDAHGKPFDGSVVLGALGSSRAVYAAALGVEADGIPKKWAQAHSNYQPPVIVERGNAPVKEVAIAAPN